MNEIWACSNGEMMLTGGKPKYTERKMSQYQFARHKFHLVWGVGGWRLCLGSALRFRTGWGRYSTNKMAYDEDFDFPRNNACPKKMAAV